MEQPIIEYEQNPTNNSEMISKMQDDLNHESDFLEISLINEIYQTIEQLDSKCQGKIGEDIVEERIRQLSYAKVLTDVYQKDESILIKPYTCLGEAYYDINYYEQAKEHLETALKLNSEKEDEKILDEIYVKKITFKICKCYLETNLLGVCIKMGERLLEESKNIYEDNLVCNTEIYEVLYKAYHKSNQINKCLSYISLLYNNYEKIYGKISIQCANLTEEIAEIYQKIQKYELSIEYYKKYYDMKKQIMESDENKNYDEYEEFFQIAVKISELYTISKNYAKSYEVLKKAEEDFGKIANRTLKNKAVYQRCVIKVSKFLENIDLYLKEYLKLKEILKDATENQKALAKTCIAIGHIYDEKKEWEKSQDYFKQAKTIFENHNDKKSMEEVQKFIDKVQKEMDNEIFT